MMFEIKDFTENEKCSNCGQCCSNLLPLSSGEIIRIKSYIKKHNIKEQRHNYMNGVDMTCPFRDEANEKCLIYSIRPAICRQFMCNHTIEDIKAWKLDFHKKFEPVFMRNEFYGNSEDLNYYENFIKLLNQKGGAE